MDTVVGNVGWYVKLVGEQNFYLEYEVAVQAFNDIGDGPLSPIVVIRSAMGRTLTTHCTTLCACFVC